ncbi:ATP-binding protein [Gillisia sp. M10.2A]|uniref:histidine kinase n=1 Tax=Gillisia lutea TaxID=2909668 RepID=A0ABS9EGD1_9FLAO|nr:PAS domain-containing sensor histidine kinase [Gillisia lutea]MCF4101916.1 ATP-binding protein [Gillisia lutea]
MQSSHSPRISNVLTTQAGVALIVSLIVLFGWIFHVKEVLSIIPGSPTMKFNTALAFLFSSIGVLIARKGGRIFRIFTYILAISILIISVLTLAQYVFAFNYNIDNLFIVDPYSQTNPGRMSPATAFCFSLLSLSLLGTNSQSIKLRTATNHVLLAITIIAMFAIFGFILQIPAKGKIFFFDSMAIHTAILFRLTSQSLSYKNPTYGFTALYLGDYAGSKLMRWILPFLIVFPLSLGYWLLYIINNNMLNVEFGVAICAISCTLVCIFYVAMVAIRLNNSDRERKKLENELYESNQELSHFKKALDASSIVATTDRKGVITYVNNKFCEISKYGRDELIGQTHKILNSGHHSKEFFKSLWKKIGNGEVWIGGIKNRAKDGTYYWVHTAIVPFKDENGKIYQYLAIRQDITKLTMLSSQYENLKLRNKEIEQFTYIASHDLQEPLRTVNSMVDLIQQDYHHQLDEEALVCLDFVMDATTRMSNLIKGLLDYSRIGGDKHLVKVNLMEMVETVTKDLSSLILETNTKITTGDLPMTMAYSTELRLLFQNLISNAIKFQEKGNRPEIHISALQTNEHWQISVRDNGIGLANPSSRNIFAIFKKLNNHSEFEGTGIGLAHCEKIVHLHGGEIWVDSELHKGSTFNFTIFKYS